MEGKTPDAVMSADGEHADQEGAMFSSSGC